MSRRRRTIALSAIKFLVPLLIISWLVWRVEPEQWEALRDRPIDYPLLVLAILASLLAFCISFFRWWLLVRCQGISIGIIEAFRLGAIGFLLSFVSAGSVGGDLFKMVFLARRSPGKGLEAVASVIVDRGVGLLGLIWLVALAMSQAGRPSNPELTRIGDLAVVLAVLGTAVLLLLVLGGRAIDRSLSRAARWRYVGGWIDRVAGPIRVFHRHPWVFLGALPLSLAVHLSLAVGAHLIARGLYGDLAPGIGDHFVIFPIANLASALPIAPAGLGVLEAAMEWLYRVVPAEPTVASGTLVALVCELVKVIMAIIGMIFYWVADGELKSSLAAAQTPVATE